MQIADGLPRAACIGDAEVGVGVQDDGFLRRPEVTYVPIRRGFVYLAAVIDWFRRCADILLPLYVIYT